MKKGNGAIYILLILMFLQVASCVLHSQEIENRHPKLGKHQFTGTNIIRDPFINTNFSFLACVGQTINYNAIIWENESGRSLGLEGEVLFVDINAKYQQRIREWIALYVQYGYYGRLGTEFGTIVLQGINTSQSFDIGWKVRIFESDKHLLSGIIELQDYDINLIDVGGYVRDVINNEPYPSINKHIPLLLGVFGFEYAYGLNELLGIYLSSEIIYGESLTSTENSASGIFSGALDFNFKQKYNFPIGIVLAHTTTSEPEYVYTDNRWANITNLKIAYTGSKDFSLGLEVSVMQSPVQGMREEPFARLVGLTSKYYF